MWHAFESAFALSNNEQLTDLYYNLGYICAFSGEIEYAKRCFRLSLSSGPNNPDALAALAQLAYFEGDRQKAVTLFKASITTSGQGDVSLEMLYNLAICFEELGDYDNAFKYGLIAQNGTNGLGAVDKDIKNLMLRLQEIMHSL